MNLIKHKETFGEASKSNTVPKIFNSLFPETNGKLGEKK